MTTKFYSALGVILVLTSSAFAREAPKHASSPAETQAAKLLNHSYLRESGHINLFKQDSDMSSLFSAGSAKAATPPVRTQARPASEVEDFGYILVDGVDKDEPEIQQFHQLLAQNLPAGIKIVIVVEDSDYQKVRAAWLQWISADRVIFAKGNDLSDITWGRDSYPIPVYDDSGNVQLVAHRYFRTSEAASAIKTVFKNVVDKNFVAVGGNLTATPDGECFVVDSERRFDLDEGTYKSVFRCARVHFLPYKSGIGDVDEVIKPLGNRIVLTNQEEYVSTLQQAGLTVKILPKPETDLGTYANTVVLGNTVFMPAYNEPTDQIAAGVYSSLGYKVVKVPSVDMSSGMQGSVHCLTNTYPKMSESAMLALLGLKKFHVM